MNNTLSINNPTAFIWSLENTLKRVANAPNESAKRGILDRQTVQGIKWAIEFMQALNTDCMSDSELNHAIRLTYFRGNTCPAYIHA